MANKNNKTKKGKSGNKKMKQKYYLDDIEVSEEDFEHEKEECC